VVDTLCQTHLQHTGPTSPQPQPHVLVLSFHFIHPGRMPGPQDPRSPFNGGVCSSWPFQGHTKLCPQGVSGASRGRWQKGIMSLPPGAEFLPLISIEAPEVPFAQVHACRDHRPSEDLSTALLTPTCLRPCKVRVRGRLVGPIPEKQMSPMSCPHCPAHQDNKALLPNCLKHIQNCPSSANMGGPASSLSTPSCNFQQPHHLHPPSQGPQPQGLWHRELLHA
jgi:hypothetical protein